MRRRTSLLPIAVVVLVAAGAGVMFARNGSAGTFQVLNSSGEQVDKVTVKVSDRTVTFDKLAPQDARTESFRIGKDSHFDVSVRFESGRSLETSGGYVTSGIESADQIVILGDKIRIDQ